jgi:signal transduction histidine kinase
LNGIITDFINFARPRQPRLAACRLEEIIEKNIGFLASQIEARGITVHKRYQNSLPDVMADADMLYQSFLNLFINAMQAMPQGGNIDIDLQAADGIVSVRLEDEGPGIPESVMGKIWDPFFTTKEQGTGLGLGIVKNIIESHGGSIQIQNRQTHGARVTVELPVQHRPTEDGNDPHR